MLNISNHFFRIATDCSGSLLLYPALAFLLLFPCSHIIIFILTRVQSNDFQLFLGHAKNAFLFQYLRRLKA